MLQKKTWMLLASAGEDGGGTGHTCGTAHTHTHTQNARLWACIFATNGGRGYPLMSAVKSMKIKRPCICTCERTRALSWLTPTTTCRHLRWVQAWLCMAVPAETMA